MRILILPAALAALAVAGCDSDPDERTTPQESQVTARAVADVDAAMADARAARPLQAAPVIAPQEALADPADDPGVPAAAADAPDTATNPENDAT